MPAGTSRKDGNLYLYFNGAAGLHLAGLGARDPGIDANRRHRPGS